RSTSVTSPDVRGTTATAFHDSRAAAGPAGSEWVRFHTAATADTAIVMATADTSIRRAAKFGDGGGGFRIARLTAPSVGVGHQVGAVGSPVVEFTCPRCSSDVVEDFYGPC